METRDSERDVLHCLGCGRKFVQRRANSEQHRCGSCGGSSTVADTDLQLASLALKPWAYLCCGVVPPLALPHEVALFPDALAIYGHIMAQASRAEARKRAIRIMLGKAGFPEAQIKNLVDIRKG